MVALIPTLYYHKLHVISMGKVFNVKPVINKKNKQINFSLPRKKLSKKQIIEIEGGKLIKIKLEELLE